MEVYPRVCGGTQYGPIFCSSITGLSPRVRGNPSNDVNVEAFLGSIPACAGEPLADTPLSVLVWVYPRVCGGTITCRQCWRSSSGLSPRVRGNPHDA